MKQRIHRMPSVIPGTRIKAALVKPPRRGLRSVVWFLLFLGGLYWLVFLGPTFQVQQVELLGADTTALATLADNMKGQNIFRLNQTAVESAMRQVHPPIDTVTLIRGLPHTVRLLVTLRTPALRWQVNDTVYILDANGEVFQEGEKPEYENLPKVVDTSGVAVQVGQQIIVPAFIDFIQDVQEKTPQTFHRSYLRSEVTETTFHVDALLEGDIRLKFTTQRPLQEQLDGAFAIATAHPDAKVIDVRVPKWGYWKP